jgi:hypothetical protein
MYIGDVGCGIDVDDGGDKRYAILHSPVFRKRRTLPTNNFVLYELALRKFPTNEGSFGIASRFELFLEETQTTTMMLSLDGVVIG